MGSWLTTDKEKIRKFLGYPVNTQSLQNIQNAMNNLAAASTDAIDTAQSYLSELTKVEQQLKDTRPYAGAASYSTAGSSTDYYSGQRMATLREEGRRFVHELALMMGLQVMRDVFEPPAARGGGRTTR